MQHCSQCGRKIAILIAAHRNRGSFALQKHRSFKDHDLCRQCFRTVMSRALEAQRHA